MPAGRAHFGECRTGGVLHTASNVRFSLPGSILSLFVSQDGRVLITRADSHYQELILTTIRRLKSEVSGLEGFGANLEMKNHPVCLPVLVVVGSGSREISAPPIDISRGVDGFCMSQHLLTHWHHKVMATQR